MNSIGFVQKCWMVALLLVVTVAAHAQTTLEVQTTAFGSPGPPLWKVSDGDHSLWIFATLTPLEAGVNWQSAQVESVIGRAQEYIYIKAPEQKIPLNPYKLINGLRLAMKISNNPDGKRLEEVISAGLYSRFSQLVTLYRIPDMEEIRPYYAADSLRGWAVIANKLTEDHGVDSKIERLVSNNPSIARTPIHLGPEYLDYDFVRSFAERLSEGPSADEINCLQSSIASIETDIDGMRFRARAWAEGNVEALRQNRDSIDAGDICGQVLLGLNDSSNLLEDAHANWLRAAEAALGNNLTTFAVLELDQLLDASGLLEKLRARGYTIDAP